MAQKLLTLQALFQFKEQFNESNRRSKADDS